MEKWRNGGMENENVVKEKGGESAHVSRMRGKGGG